MNKLFERLPKSRKTLSNNDHRLSRPIWRKTTPPMGEASAKAITYSTTHRRFPDHRWNRPRRRQTILPRIARFLPTDLIVCYDARELDRAVKIDRLQCRKKIPRASSIIAGLLGHH